MARLRGGALPVLAIDSVQAFIHRSERSWFTPPDLPLFADLCREADDNLSNIILNNS